MTEKIAKIQKNIKNLQDKFPLIYQDQIDSGVIIDEKQQQKLSKMDSREFHDFLIQRKTCAPLNIFPEYVSPVIKNFNEDILNTLEGFGNNEGNNNDSLTLLTRIHHYSDTTKYRYLGPIAGPRFFVTKCCGYPEFLHFKPNDVSKIAPEEAKAYVIGCNGLLAKVNKEKMVDSPIIAGVSKRVDLEKGSYHIIPVRFFGRKDSSIGKYMI